MPLTLRNSGLSAFKAQGTWHRAVQLMVEQQHHGTVPDDICYNALSTICEQQDQWCAAVVVLRSAPGALLARDKTDKAWRLAKLSQLLEGPRPRTLSLDLDADWEDLSHLSFSKFVILIWSVASLSEARLGQHLCQEALRRLRGDGDASLLSMEEVAKLGWSISMLPANFATPLVLHQLQREVAKRSEGLKGDSAGSRAAFLDEALTVLWSSSFAGCLSDLASRFLWQLLQLRKIEVLPPLETNIMSDVKTCEMPQVVQLLPDQLVSLKPPGWEVDYTDTADGTGCRLSSFLSAWLTPRLLRCRQTLAKHVIQPHNLRCQHNGQTFAVPAWKGPLQFLSRSHVSSRLKLVGQSQNRRYSW